MPCNARALSRQLDGRPGIAREDRGTAGRGRSSGLTPTEQRVAELAAGGMRHDDIAATVFIARKTVEVNRSRIYRKLGIHSRIGLYRMFDDARPSALSSDEPASA